MNLEYDPTEYIAKGTGLEKGYQNRRSFFYIQSQMKNKTPAWDIQITINGPNKTSGQFTIRPNFKYGRSYMFTNYRRSRYITLQLNSVSPTLLGTSYFRILSEISIYKSNDTDLDIEIYAKMLHNRAKICFTPKKVGLYQISLKTNGCHIQGSPAFVLIESGICSNWINEETILRNSQESLEICDSVDNFNENLLKNNSKLIEHSNIDVIDNVNNNKAKNLLHNKVELQQNIMENKIELNNNDQKLFEDNYNVDTFLQNCNKDIQNLENNNVNKSYKKVKSLTQQFENIATDKIIDADKMNENLNSITYLTSQELTKTINCKTIQNVTYSNLPQSKNNFNESLMTVDQKLLNNRLKKYGALFAEYDKLQCYLKNSLQYFLNADNNVKFPKSNIKCTSEGIIRLGIVEAKKKFWQDQNFNNNTDTDFIYKDDHFHEGIVKKNIEMFEQNNCSTPKPLCYKYYPKIDVKPQINLSASTIILDKNNNNEDKLSINKTNSDKTECDLNKKRKARFHRSKIFFQKLENSSLKSGHISRSNSLGDIEKFTSNEADVQSDEFIDQEIDDSDTNKVTTKSPSLSNRFLVDDLFRDILGDRDKIFLGIPNKSAVVASLASLNDDISREEIDARTDLECFAKSDRKTGKQKSFHCYHEEYPHPPNTERRRCKSRTDLSTAGLISRQKLLAKSLDNLHP